MSDEEAARDINFSAFRDWSDEERIYVNVNACYREFANDRGRPDVLRMKVIDAGDRVGHRLLHQVLGVGVAASVGRQPAMRPAAHGRQAALENRLEGIAVASLCPDYEFHRRFVAE